MSKSLVKLLKKHPRLMGEYRRFVVGVMVDIQHEKAAKAAK